MLLCSYVKLLVALVSRLFPDFQFGWLAEEMRKNLPLELDFVHEGRNCDKVAKCFGHLPFLKVNQLLTFYRHSLFHTFKTIFLHVGFNYLFVCLHDWTV